MSHPSLSYTIQHKCGHPPHRPFRTIPISSSSVTPYASPLTVLQNLCHQHTCLQPPKASGSATIDDKLPFASAAGSSIFNDNNQQHSIHRKNCLFFVSGSFIPMTCATQTVVNPFPADTMAGYDPQKRSRTSKAPARYILFLLLALLFLFAPIPHVVRKIVFPFSQCNYQRQFRLSLDPTASCFKRHSISTTASP